MKVRAHAHEIDWQNVVAHAKKFVESHETGVTLRQLYYHIVSAGLIPNKQQAYKTLSMKTAIARRAGEFPPLIDRTRAIELSEWFLDPNDAVSDMLDTYRRDRSEGQEWSIYVGVEKHGMTTQLLHWFSKYGIPVLALGGYSSQTFVDVVRADVERQGRQSVLLYAGDYDPSGMDIDRDFEERTAIFDEVVRVALNRKLVDKYELPPMPGKTTDSRKAKFILAEGELVQVELDALPPEELRKLYQKQIDKYWDDRAYQESLEQEKRDQKKLDKLAGLVDLDDIDRASHIVANLKTPAGTRAKKRFRERILRVSDKIQDKIS